MRRQFDLLHSEFPALGISLDGDTMALEEALADDLMAEAAPEDLDLRLVVVGVLQEGAERSNPLQVIVGRVRRA